MMKRLAFAAVLPVFALACGGGGGNAALDKNFNYGAPAAPTASEQSAATSAQDGVSSAAAFSSSPDATSASTVVAMADSVIGSAMGSTTVAFNAPASLRNALSTAATIDTCTTVSGNTVTFNNCTSTESGVSVTLNGKVTGTATSVDWSIQGSFSGTDPQSGVNVSLTVGYSGSFTVSATTVKGHALVGLGGSVSNGFQTVGFGVDEAVLVDVTYQSSPMACVTGGTIEAKRVWSQRPQGATSTDLPDGGVKLTWNSCGNFNVAHSI